MSNHSKKKDPVKQLQEKPDKGDFLVAGIGASAGGIQALQEFFTHTPENSGMAYVVILHLSPDHDSRLAEVLQHTTSLPVTQVAERVKIVPNHIYVVPPDQHLIIEDDALSASQNILQEERRAPVDIFFRSLADNLGPRAISVVLSGTGANGSMGVKRIKERGGACFVQNPREAEFNEMPRNAIATEMVDGVLPVAEIPAKLISYKVSMGTVEIVEETINRPEVQQQALREIFTQLRLRTGHDFSNYKRPTLLRRIERRINIFGLPDLPAYARYLMEHPDEPAALLKDLLISVTNFFRDRKPFAIIEHEVLPLIFRTKTKADRVRIWVAGCATGEEAYSIAMLCAELSTGTLDVPKVQIFATDINESAIAQAREGLYTMSDTADVSPERLRRFFNKEGDNYRIRREIRETIMFANHNFLRDPPFSHLDVVACRNALIYLNQVAQERVVETFHFALNPGGFLFLGTSESVDSANDLYTGYNRENHIFQSRQAGLRAYPVPESTPAMFSDQFKKDISSQENENRILERISFGDLHQQLLEEYAPPSLVVNEEFDVVHVTERAGKYLQVSGGELSQNLLKLVKPELRLELRSALYQALQRQSAVEAHGLTVMIDNKPEAINLLVRPVLRTDKASRGFILVLFEPAREEIQQKILVSSDEPVAKQLEEEIIRLKTQLRSSSEQHDFQAEEMKAANEELQAMNEELRSAAEELETSKEELQSINEELRTVNQELKVKIEETAIYSNNLQNLINSTDIGTIFLDRSYRVVLYTPATSSIFNLIATDYGRPLSDITSRLENVDVMKDAETVLETLTVVEREVRTRQNRIYVMRTKPYRTDEDRIRGVVITFVDITKRKRDEELLRQAADFSDYRMALNEELQALGKADKIKAAASRLLAEKLKADQVYIAELEPDGLHTVVSSGYFQTGTGADLSGRYAVSELSRPLYREAFAGRRGVAPDAQAIQDASEAEKVEFSRLSVGAFITQPVMRANRLAAVVWVSSAAPRNWNDEEITYVTETAERTWSAVERARTKEALRLSEARLRITMESVVDYAIISTDSKGLIIGWNKGAERIFGYHPEEVTGRPVSLIYLPEDVEAGIPEKELATAREKGRAADDRWHLRKDGTRFYMSGVLTPISDPELTGYVKVATDMTERQQAQEDLMMLEERYRIALQSAEMAAWDWNILQNTVVWNDQHYYLLGSLPDGKEKKASDFLLSVHELDRERVTAALEEALIRTGVYKAEFRIRRADNGEVRWMSGYGRAVTEQEKVVTRMVGVMYDITTRKQLEQQREDFIGIASHELKTPVTSIKAYTELLQDHFEEEADAVYSSLITKLDTQVDRLINLVHTLLDTTRITNGQLLLHPQAFSLNNMITERVEDLQRLTEKHRLVFMPEEDITVTADEERIRQVFTNLLSNAIKYSLNGGEITVAWTAVKEGVEISVRDRGIGIPAAMQQKVFDRFFRVEDKLGETLPGIGLGLFITATIIRQHKGNIWLESREGEGTTVYFVIPIYFLNERDETDTDR